MDRLPASSLLEAVIALGLLAAVLSTALAVQFRVREADRAWVRLVAWDLSEELIAHWEPQGHRNIPARSGLHVDHVSVPVDGHHHLLHIRISHGDTEVLLREVIIDRP
ncbi:MAG TPA: hypothetical protein PKE21_13575 [Flavobacteriales bacterium]|nr:hypothetical protein [Flavobacteriales bacterium]HMR28506.1 hypothetical protein [Flavobacteriales bacterium]